MSEIGRTWQEHVSKKHNQSKPTQTQGWVETIRPTTGEWTESKVLDYYYHRPANQWAELLSRDIKAEIQQLRSQLADACKVSQDSQRALWNATKQLAIAKVKERK